jgi:hypothetical protein
VHQVALDLATVSPVPKTREPPAYGVILLEPERTLVHVSAFLEESRIEGAVSPQPPQPPEPPQPLGPPGPPGPPEPS